MLKWKSTWTELSSCSFPVKAIDYWLIIEVWWLLAGTFSVFVSELAVRGFVSSLQVSLARSSPRPPPSSLQPPPSRLQLPRMHFPMSQPATRKPMVTIFWMMFLSTFKQSFGFFHRLIKVQFCEIHGCNVGVFVFKRNSLTSSAYREKKSKKQRRRVLRLQTYRLTLDLWRYCANQLAPARTDL